MTFAEIFDMVVDSFFVAVLLDVVSMAIYYGYKKYKKEEWNRPLRVAIFLLYIYMLINITVFRGQLFQNETHSFNLIPFDELLSASYYQASVLGKKQALVILAYNVIGNIVWFIPFGIILCVYAKNMTIKKTVLYSFLLSLSIELLQYVFYTGVSDIDDIIFNVVGGVVGYGIYRLINKRRISCR